MATATSPVPTVGNPTSLVNSFGGKRKRRPAGTPDPDAEVVSLTPRTLMESDRYVCEICGQGFQRDQNLQMHRRRHKVPWRLLKREAAGPAAGGGAGAGARKRVYVCPEPSCLHHDPAHALGDLVGIKKHYRRKHSAHRQWSCARCGKAYAVQSDYKAHLKTCGTRGHSCDCGRVFSRVESFIEHQDACAAGRTRAAEPLARAPAIPSPPRDMETGAAPWAPLPFPKEALELQLLPSSSARRSLSPLSEKNLPSDVPLILSLGAGGGGTGQLGLAMAEKKAAEEARGNARKQIEVAERELANAKMIRAQAQAELSRALAVRDHAVRQINATLFEVTCRSCRQQFRALAPPPPPSDDHSLAASSALSEGEGENDDNRRHEPVVVHS